MTELYDTSREPVGDRQVFLPVVIHNGQVIPGCGVIAFSGIVNYSKAA